MTSWESQWRAIGEKGTALWDGSNAPHAQVIQESGGFHSQFSDVQGVKAHIPGGIAGSLTEFLDALETGETPNGECHDNIKSLAMVFAAIESAKLGAPVDVKAML